MFGSLPAAGDENSRCAGTGSDGEDGCAIANRALAPVAKASAPATNDDIGLIDVKQSDLLQKQTQDNWVSYNGDYAGRRYSALTQVTPANVSHLAAKWVFHTQEAGPLEVTPVVIAGVMFITAGNDAHHARNARDGQAALASLTGRHGGAGR